MFLDSSLCFFQTSLLAILVLLAMTMHGRTHSKGIHGASCQPSLPVIHSPEPQTLDSANWELARNFYQDDADATTDEGQPGDTYSHDEDNNPGYMHVSSPLNPQQPHADTTSHHVTDTKEFDVLQITCTFTDD
ncbi:hypothetical protein C0989_006503 [Termitomyces sp. Mn162]|nr:hypothetical protein C0989_006503 [Termitomyces sp. Mn162]KAH0589970.1 hypothetical protein H2248_000152 [Termitomyces sp. 'cryptogamus']